ncbi:shikimate kinase [Verrucomicrobiota bacterium]
MKRVFIIGPGGVGKTTCGGLFATKIGYVFVDVDSEFMRRIGHIGEHIEQRGHADYCRANSALLYELLEEQTSDTVFALSSGFLVHEDVDCALTKHRSVLRLGVSILVLPSESLEETEAIIVPRQLARGIGCREETQRRAIRDRHPRYLHFGDIKVLSIESPSRIAEAMKAKYLAIAEPSLAVERARPAASRPSAPVN